MEDKNKFAREWYQITYNELRDLMNQHWQINQANPFHSALPGLAAHIRRVAACCEVWRAVAYYNATQKFYKGG